MQTPKVTSAPLARREFLLHGLAGALAAGAAAGNAFAKEEAQLDIIDTHTHFYDPMRPQGVPWPGKNATALYRPMLPAEFRKLAEPHGVVGTVVVEASPWVEDNQWLLDLAEKEKTIVGVVGHLDPGVDDFQEHLRRFARNPLYRGIRISHGALSEGLKANLVERCKLLVEHDLELDVNGGPEMPAQVADLARQLPELRIVINHCANVRIDGREPPPNWRKAMAAAARGANVFCKVSALPATLAADRYRPVLDALWALFGEDRLLFGSNWPVSGRGEQFGKMLGFVRDYFTDKGEAASKKFFRSNSQLAYAWRQRGFK
jgi:predicted TIM-barrel fold metal-dependent hydrolase